MKKLSFVAVAACIFMFMALLATPFFLVSCSKKAVLTPVNIQPIVYQTDNVTVTVEPKIELIMIALRLAEVEPFRNNVYGQEYSQYLDGVDKIFANQKEHPLVKEIKSRCKNYKKSFNEILKITRYISDDMTEMTISQNEIPEDMLAFWKGINLKTFIQQFNDFAVSSNYERVWLVYNSQLKSQAIAVQEYFAYNKKITDWVSSFFYNKDYAPDYEIHATITSGGYSYLPGPIYNSVDNKMTVQVISPAFWNKENDWNATQDAMNFAGCSIYYLVKKHWELLSAETIRIIEKIYEQNQITEKVTDFLAQSELTSLLTLSCLFDFDNLKNDEDLRASLYNALTTQFLIEDPDKLLSVAEYYKNNRDQFPTFDLFVENYLPAALKEF